MTEAVISEDADADFNNVLSEDEYVSCSFDADDLETYFPYSSEAGSQQQNKTWDASYKFTPLSAAPPMEVKVSNTNIVRPLDAFNRYIPENIISDIALATSQRITSESGRDIGVSAQMMKQFIGINIIMSYIKYPRIRMYWAAKTCVPQIADVMSRNQFFIIRTNLTCRDYTAVTKEEKKMNSFWKINPILECVRNACLDNTRDENVSIYQQKIPLRRQDKTNLTSKPNPVVLKNFISITSDGLPLDFFLYQVKGITDIESKVDLDLGGKVVVKLSESLLAGCHVYLNKCFTSLTVMEVLFTEGIHCTGTLQLQRIPKECDLECDSGIGSMERGSYVQLVREDGQFSIVKWRDEEIVVIVSNVHGALPQDVLARWSKSRNAYIHINMPDVISKYKANTFGAQFFERTIAQYRINAKSNDWTVKTVFHFIDFAIAAAWIERRRAEKHQITGDRLQLIDFKVEIAYELLHCGMANEDIYEVDKNREALASTVGLPNKRKVVPLPSDALRYTGALHLPERPLGAKLSRCRMPGCSSPKCRFWCKTCKVFLCLTSTRNCFKMFHEL